MTSTGVHGVAVDATRAKGSGVAAAGLALTGSVLLFAGTWLHPSSADPADSAAAFTEYGQVSRTAWVVAHAAQLAGVAAMVLTVVLLVGLVTTRSAWTRVTTAVGGATVAVAAVLQAVDGVALKAMVDRWLAAPEPQRSVVFEASVALRQVEIGLDALLAIAAAATILLFGLAVLRSTAPLRTIVGGLSVAVASVHALAGAALATGGYSGTAMLLTMLSGVTALAWILVLAAWAWRLPRR